jgi:uncharacterized membrane protein YgaE (UPF0421/DUF939 family)
MPKNKQENRYSALKHSLGTGLGISIAVLRQLPQPFSG